MDKDDQTIQDQIRELVNSDHFTPFEIVMASGSRYRIEHENNLAIGQTTMVYLHPKTDKLAILKIGQITDVETMETA